MRRLPAEVDRHPALLVVVEHGHEFQAGAQLFEVVVVQVIDGGTAQSSHSLHFPPPRYESGLIMSHDS
ncbi:MAG TPA: hypothetical protein VM142_13810 [Acidimicrobiales bacterium]|nr:hypothetical protein [Acidimicrobiales bacterium]